MCLDDFNGHVGRHIDGFDGVHGGHGVVQRNLEGRMLLEFRLEMQLCVSNTCFNREENRKVTFRMGENEKEIESALMKKEHRRSMRNVMAITGEFQHALVIADIDKRKIRKIAINTCAERRKICLLKEVVMTKRFEGKVIELVDVGAPKFVGTFPGWCRQIM